MPAALDVPVFHQAMEELKVLTQDDLERERYEARLKLERDALSRERERVRSIAEAEAKVAKAEAAGMLIGRIHLGQRLRQQPLTPVEELRALPLAELNRVAEQLENELLTGQSRNQGT